MPLELVDHRAEARSWTPFPSSEGYECPRWWENAGGAVGDPWFVQVLEYGAEVARVQLDERCGINPIYPVTPAALWGELLEIQYIEVTGCVPPRFSGAAILELLVGLTPSAQPRRIRPSGSDC